MGEHRSLPAPSEKRRPRFVPTEKGGSDRSLSRGRLNVNNLHGSLGQLILWAPVVTVFGYLPVQVCHRSELAILSSLHPIFDRTVHGIGQLSAFKNGGDRGADPETVWCEC
jgi:hypothetical protein